MVSSARRLAVTLAVTQKRKIPETAWLLRFSGLFGRRRPTNFTRLISSRRIRRSLRVGRAAVDAAHSCLSCFG